MRGCRALTDDEVKLIFEKGFNGIFKLRNQALFGLGVATGFRISELLALRVTDVWRGGSITKYVGVPRRYMKNKKTGRVKRIDDKARIALRRWVDELREEEGIDGHTKLFQSREGRNRSLSLVQSGNIIKYACHSVGIVEPDRILGTHIMRKTFARRVYFYYLDQFRTGGVTKEPLLLTMLALGHTDPKNTLKYLSFLSEEIPSEITDIY